MSATNSFESNANAQTNVNNIISVENVQPAHVKLHKKMRKREDLQQKTRSFRSHVDAAYQGLRSAVVDWICQVCRACALKSLTTHSAIGFVDMLLDMVPVDKSRIQLVAIACILIAAKIEEQDGNVPRVQSLLICSGNVFSKELVLRMESYILNMFKWEVMIITPVNFLEYYQEIILHPTELVMNPQIHNHERCKTRLCKTAEFLIDLSEHNSYFRQYLPSVVAASAVAVSRQIIGVQPVWSDALQAVTSYSVEAITDCANMIFSCYYHMFPQEGV